MYNLEILNGVTVETLNGSEIQYHVNSDLILNVNTNEDVMTVLTSDKQKYRRVEFSELVDNLGASNIKEYAENVVNSGMYRTNANVTNTEVTPTIDTKKIVDTLLLNGNSKDMAIDGSVSSILFSYTAVEDTALNQIGFYIEDDRNFESERIGAIIGVFTGVQLLNNGVELLNLKTNEEFIMSSRISNSTNLTAVRRSLSSLIDLNGTILKKGEVFSVVIRDDLSDLEIFNAKIKGLEI